MTDIQAVVFDLGGVLIDWDPRYLYRPLFGDDVVGMERFLAEVCSPEWNLTLDRGRPWSEAVEALSREHPQHRDHIVAFHERWAEMLGGPIHDTVAILGELRADGVPLYALSNWSAETFPIAVERYAFLRWFDEIVISGDLGIAKPDRRIFEHLIGRRSLVPGSTLFIDDMPANVASAEAVGMRALQFHDANRLRADLVRLGVLESLATARASQD